MRVLGLVTLAAVLACGDSTGNNGDGSLNVAGTWTGTLTITTAGGTFTGPATLSLDHTGSAIGGVMDFAEADESLDVGGFLEGSELTIVMTAVQGTSDDCHLFPVTIVFTATATTLTAVSGSGQACDGDGMGGHEPLDPVTGASGTLSR